MKQLTITRLTETGRIAAVQVPTILNEAGIAFQPIDELNWSEYPYKPKVEFRIAHTGHSLLLHYRVTEQSVRAVAESDNGRVWEDACCEFFIQPNLQEPVYYNFECNCAGTLLLNCGKVGDRHPAPKEVLASIDRWSSLGREPFEERIGECSWELALVIPASALFNDTITDSISADGPCMVISTSAAICCRYLTSFPGIRFSFRNRVSIARNFSEN